MRSKTRRAMLLATCMAALFGGHAQAADLVIRNVTIVNVRDGSLAPDMAVVITGDRIESLAPAASVTQDPDVRQVDGQGRFLVPGYNDMHTHHLNSPSPQTSLPLLLAHGVTGFRQMAGTTELLANRAAGNRLISADDPALLSLPGPVLFGPTVATPDAIRAEIRAQKAAGADFIKVVEVPPEAFLAGAEEAKALDIAYAGHMPATVDPRDAIRAGMTAIEHMGPTISLLLDCSTAEDAIRAEMAQASPVSRNIDFNLDPAALARLTANPVLLTPPAGFALIARVLATYDEARCQALASDLAASDTWVVPSLSRLEAMYLGNAPELRNNPALQYVTPRERQLWNAVGDEFATRLTADQQQILADLLQRHYRLVKLFDDKGVKMTFGTDFGGQWLVSGQSAHHEFDLLARAGIPPLRILQMATLDAARYLRRETTMGTVEAGKAADLVLLGGNPLADAANLHRVEGVVRAGRYHDAAALQAIREQAAETLRDR